MAQATPNWALRWIRSALKLLAASVLLALVAIAAWHLWPRDRARFALTIETRASVNLGGRELGSGVLELDDATLRGAGVVVPRGASLTDIAAAIDPVAEFRGAHGQAAIGEGVQYFWRTADGQWRIARVWLFDDGEQWLAVAVHFRHGAHIQTRASDQNLTLHHSLSSAWRRRQDQSCTARVDPIADPLPGVDDYMIGGIAVR